MTYSEKLKDPRWQKRRLEILSSDKFTCQICGNQKETLNVHHFCYNGDPWNVTDGDATTLCESCHKMQHLKHALSYEELLMYRFIERVSIAITHKQINIPLVSNLSDIKQSLFKKYG